MINKMAGRWTRLFSVWIRPISILRIRRAVSVENMEESIVLAALCGD